MFLNEMDYHVNLSELLTVHIIDCDQLIYISSTLNVLLKIFFKEFLQSSHHIRVLKQNVNFLLAV